MVSVYSKVRRAGVPASFSGHEDRGSEPQSYTGVCGVSRPRWRAPHHLLFTVYRPGPRPGAGFGTVGVRRGAVLFKAQQLGLRTGVCLYLPPPAHTAGPSAGTLPGTAGSLPPRAACRLRAACVHSSGVGNQGPPPLTSAGQTRGKPGPGPLSGGPSVSGSFSRFFSAPDQAFRASRASRSCGLDQPCP